MLGRALAADSANYGSPAFRVAMEVQPRDLHPMLRDKSYRIAVEALRNAFRHAHAHHLKP
jgi:signal transduction histidine kinase